MPGMIVRLAAVVVISLLIALQSQAMASDSSKRRVPAEWEPQEAVWLQWPGRWEKTYEPAFAQFSRIIADYQKLHILFHSKKVEQQARAAISAAGGNPDHANIVWHQVANDSAWMRDNGPVYIEEDDQLKLQNWEFDAWGGAFGPDVTYHHDNRVPVAVAAYLRLPLENIDIVHERGNLEFNGVDTVLLNWSVIGDPRRNPGYSRVQAEADLKKHFGVSRVVMIEGVTDGDLTNGHIDGIARFINEETVVVPDCTVNSRCKPDDGGDDAVYDNAARVIEAAGFKVIRDPILATVHHRGNVFDTNYMNWIVGNGFVIAVGFGHAKADAAAKKRLQQYFPGREVHIVEMLESWAAGGGVHCHTNDQPALSLAGAAAQ